MTETIRQKHTMVITLDNVTPHDAYAIKRMFEHVEKLGRQGSSRKVTLYADGDGSLHPKVKVDYPISLPELDDNFVDDNDNFTADSDNIFTKLKEKLDK